MPKLYLYPSLSMRPEPLEDGVPEHFDDQDDVDMELQDQATNTPASDSAVLKSQQAVDGARGGDGKDGGKEADVQFVHDKTTVICEPMKTVPSIATDDKKGKFTS